MAWKGVILEESLEDKSLLNLVKIVKTNISKLEGENRVMTFHKIEVEDNRKDEFLEKAKKSIKQAFYLHIVKNGEMYVVFRGVVFNFRKGDENLQKARDYGKSIGILEAQMPFEKLIENPFA